MSDCETRAESRTRDKNKLMKHITASKTSVWCLWSDKCAVLPVSLRRRLAAGFTVAAELCDTQAAAARGVRGRSKPSVPTASAAAERGPPELWIPLRTSGEQIII